jgi:hypothetical protein
MPDKSRQVPALSVTIGNFNPNHKYRCSSPFPLADCWVHMTPRPAQSATVVFEAIRLGLDRVADSPLAAERHDVRQRR